MVAVAFGAREENFVEVGGGSAALRFLPRRVVMAHERRRGSWRESDVNEKPCVRGATGGVPGLVGLG